MKKQMKKFFDNPEKYINSSSWSNSGLLDGLSAKDREILTMYFYYFIKIHYKLINEELSSYYLPSLRRVFSVVLESGKLFNQLEKNNLDEVELDLEDFINYINTKLPKTLKGLSHLYEELDHEAEACLITCNCYINKIRNIYRDDTLLKNYIKKLRRNNKIDTLIN